MTEADYMHDELCCATHETTKLSISTNNMVLSQMSSVLSRSPEGLELGLEQSKRSVVTGRKDGAELDYPNELGDSDDGHKALPPPKVFLRKKCNADTLEKFLTRSSSCQPVSSKPHSAKQLLKSKNMTRSMPNANNSRSEYNRKVGSTLDCVASTYGIHHAVHDRVMEFDSLLDSLWSLEMCSAKLLH